MMKPFKKYAYRKYSNKFPDLFKKEKSKLKRILTKDAVIEHVGSTAVPGLGGKGIIDIAIKTPKNKVNRFTKQLKRLGYQQKKEHRPTKNSIFFQKIIKYKGKERRIHVHLTLNDYFWNTFIAVRDYLKTHGKERKEYAKIKKDAVKKGLEGENYREHKKDFLENLTRRALKEFG